MSLRPCWYWPHGGDVHLELFVQLGVGEALLLVALVVDAERHALGVEPGPDGVGFLVGHLAHLGDERGLRQALLVDAGRVEVFVVDQGVVHAHAVLVEDGQDRLVDLELLGQRLAEALLLGVGQGGQVAHVRLVVDDGAGLQPFGELLPRPVVREVLAPQRRVGLADLGERTGDVEQADEAGEVAGEVGDDQDRAGVVAQAVEDVVGVLPHRFDHDEGGLGRHVLEDFHAVVLAIDEAVSGLGVDAVGALDFPAERLDGGGELGLDLLLLRPSLDIGGETKVAVRNGVDGLRLGLGPGDDLREVVGGHVRFLLGMWCAIGGDIAVGEHA